MYNIPACPPKKINLDFNVLHFNFCAKTELPMATDFNVQLSFLKFQN